MPPSRRQVYRRRRATVAAIIAVFACVGIYLPTSLLAPLAPVTAIIDARTIPEQTPAELAWPGYGASAIGAVGFDGVLAANGTAEARPIASISKIITSLVVLDAKPLTVGEAGPDITFSSADARLYDKYLAANGKVEPMQAGLTMTEHQVLEVVLVSSANNYAESLAHWAFGSQEAFLTAATSWLAENGFSATRLVEPTGMSEHNVSSAADLVGIGKLAIGNPVIAGIVASRGIDAPLIGRLPNSNKLLGIDGVDGIKTGTLEKAGACLLFSADVPVGSDTVPVVGVVLGGVDHDTLDIAVRSLLASVNDGFHEVELVEKGEEFASYDTPWEEQADAVAKKNASIIVWSDTPISAKVSTERLTIATSGEIVGSVTFTAGKQKVEVPLSLDASLSGPDPWWRLSHAPWAIPG